ncbi:MAG: 3-phosphoserine/phosphohydroxythreonine transaminase [Oscillospiraceae bacterium]|jgi:phosphoserine aminotransferase|nr:3-phosphoserine/phosphohydroxythreonine transaminase [Oscillospiraceae bacterium]
MGRVFNFSAGPAMMPETVLKRAAAEITDYGASGMSVMEMSHRSKVFDAIITQTEASLREVMSIPEEYKVLFLQGGATLQFAMAAMNLIGKTGKADYAVTGQFSGNAFKEGKKFGAARALVDTSDITFSKIPQQSELAVDPEASYVHYCMNNTIFGTKWPYIPETGGVPLVCDISSCILSEPVDVSRFGLLYAGAQKNMGPAGLAVVILREDVLHPISPLPTYLDYAAQIKAQSMYNTPPTYGIYLLGLVLDWVKEMGGLDAMKVYNEKKAKVVYDALDDSKLFTSKVDKQSRSMMNVVFTTNDADKDAAFIKGAAARGLVTLAGHRLVGGMRASIYNAMPMEGVEKLAQYMNEFEKEN